MVTRLTCPKEGEPKGDANETLIREGGGESCYGRTFDLNLEDLRASPNAFMSPFVNSEPVFCIFLARICLCLKSE